MLRYPIDKDHFAEISTNWKEDMLRYGLIIVPILNENEIVKSQTALWDHMGPKVTSDYKTWETENWPQPETPFLSTDYAIDEQAFRNRVHPRLIEVFKILYNTNALLTTVDFYGIKRATLFPTGERKDWRTKALRLHWDVDLKSYVNDKKSRYQALIALNDNTLDTGSFACVSGSHNLLGEWISRYDAENGKYVPKGNFLHKYIQRIPIRQGCAAIWDMGLAHANFENISHQPRLTQYVRMLPNESWALARESQCITHYWKIHPEHKARILKLEWTPEEHGFLGF